MLVLHKVLRNGSTVHEEFSRGSWDAAVRNSDVVRCWGHEPHDCRDFVREFLDGRIELVQNDEESPPPGEEPDEPINWPPSLDLTPWMLCQLTTLGIDDARNLLTRREYRKMERRPVADPKGQFSLF